MLLAKIGVSREGWRGDTRRRGEWMRERVDFDAGTEMAK